MGCWLGAHSTVRIYSHHHLIIQLGLIDPIRDLNIFGASPRHLIQPRTSNKVTHFTFQINQYIYQCSIEYLGLAIVESSICIAQLASDSCITAANASLCLLVKYSALIEYNTLARTLDMLTNQKFMRVRKYFMLIENAKFVFTDLQARGSYNPFITIHSP